MKILQFLLN